MSYQNFTDEDRQKLMEMALSRRQFLRTATGLAGLVALSPMMSACGGPAPTAQAPAATSAAPAATSEAAATSAPAAAESGGTLVFAAESMGESLEPGLWNGFGAANVLDNVFDGLTRSGEKWTDPAAPGLAESWTVSEDGKTYLFKIRQGVKFHDGSTLDAKAVVRSLTRQTNKDDSSYVEGLYMNAEYGIANWGSITAEDDSTVKLVLKEPDAAQLHRLFHPASVIISSAALDKYGPNINLNPVGAGPYKMEKFVPGQEATLAAFDDYWDGRPAIDKLVIRGYPDEGAMLAAIESGEVQFTPYPPSSAIQRLQADDRLKV